MPKISYIVKGFRPESLALIDKINEVVDEYKAQGYDLTLRQVYYQMVARDVIPNNERSYKNLDALLNDARLAGRIDWGAIEDRTRNLRKRAHWEEPGDVIESAADSFHLDYWEGQGHYVEVWVEKDALVGIVGEECNRLDVPFFSCRGYVSQSEMWAAAQRLKAASETSRKVVLLHLGDHDPSGVDMSRDICERNTLFGNVEMEFHRLALNMDQIKKYSPPPNPTKLSDSRAGGYVGKYGYSCWELDALEPKALSGLIRDNVLKYRDEGPYRTVKERERLEKERLLEMAGCWNELSECWDDHKDSYRKEN